LVRDLAPPSWPIALGFSCAPAAPPVASDGPERMIEIVTTLAVVGEVLAALIVKLASATADEIPALCDEAEICAARC
jgi:hypothetical protein